MISDTHGRLGIISEPAVHIRADAVHNAGGLELVVEKGAGVGSLFQRSLRGILSFEFKACCFINRL
jgi:hypothetical protein